MSWLSSGAEAAILSKALESAYRHAPVILRGVIKARVGHLAARQAQLDGAIEHARTLHDDLVTARAALRWNKREGDAA